MTIQKPIKPKLYILHRKQRTWAKNPGLAILDPVKEDMRKELPVGAVDVEFKLNQGWDFHLIMTYKIPFSQEDQVKRILSYHQKRTEYRASLLKALDDLNAEELTDLQAPL
jgi:hypothetical protein